MADNDNSVFTEHLTEGNMYTSAEVTKNTKGYNWSVKCAGFDSEHVKEKVVEMNNFLKEKFGE